jgi:hypothetical protein
MRVLLRLTVLDGSQQNPDPKEQTSTADIWSFQLKRRGAMASAGPIPHQRVRRVEWQHEIASGEIGLDRLFCAAAIQSRACLLRVISSL